MNELIETIIQALRVARDESFAKKNYNEEIKYDRCLLKIQSLKREQEVFEGKYYDLFTFLEY